MEVMLAGGVQQHHVENLLEFDIVTLLSDASGSPLGFCWVVGRYIVSLLRLPLKLGSQACRSRKCLMDDMIL